MTDGRDVPLTGKEYSILELLMLRMGTVLTEDVLLNHLYGGLEEPAGKIIDVFICKVRKKLAQAGMNDLIGTVWGRGYVIRKPVVLIRPYVCACRAGAMEEQSCVYTTIFSFHIPIMLNLLMDSLIEEGSDRSPWNARSLASIAA